MCILLVLLSIIPILCGYVIYPGVATLVSDATPPVQLSVGLLAAATTVGGLRQLWRRNRQHTLTGEESVSGVLEESLEPTPEPTT